MSVIGYARVSTREQNPDSQVAELDRPTWSAPLIYDRCGMSVPMSRVRAAASTITVGSCVGTGRISRAARASLSGSSSTVRRTSKALRMHRYWLPTRSWCGVGETLTKAPSARAL